MTYSKDWSFTKLADEAAKSSVKWQVGTRKYSINAPMLVAMEIATIMHHMIEVPSTVRQLTFPGDNAGDLGPSLFLSWK